MLAQKTFTVGIVIILSQNSVTVVCTISYYTMPCTLNVATQEGQGAGLD